MITKEEILSLGFEPISEHGAQISFKLFLGGMVVLTLTRHETDLVEIGHLNTLKASYHYSMAFDQVFYGWLKTKEDLRRVLNQVCNFVHPAFTYPEKFHQESPQELILSFREKIFKWEIILDQLSGPSNIMKDFDEHFGITNFRGDEKSVENKVAVYDIMRKGEKVGVVFDPMLVHLLTDFLNTPRITMNLVASDLVDHESQLKELEAKILSYRTDMVDLARGLENSYHPDALAIGLVDAYDKHFGIETQKEGKIETLSKEAAYLKYFEILDGLPDDAFVRKMEFPSNTEEAVRNLVEYCRYVAREEDVIKALALLKEIASSSVSPDTYDQCVTAVTFHNEPYVIKTQP